MSLLFIAAVVLAVSGLAPSWVIAPPSVLLVAYLGVLRAAGQIDAERRQLHAERAYVASQPSGISLEDAESTDAEDPDAEVIPLAPGARAADEPYDQYTDASLRAVGD